MGMRRRILNLVASAALALTILLPWVRISVVVKCSPLGCYPVPAVVKEVCEATTKAPGARVVGTSGCSNLVVASSGLWITLKTGMCCLVASIAGLLLATFWRERRIVSVVACSLGLLGGITVVAAIDCVASRIGTGTHLQIGSYLWLAGVVTAVASCGWPRR